jgi:acyl carrier protein
MEHIKQVIKNYISTEFLPQEDAHMLTDETTLVNEGILDSLAILRLVVFIEEHYKIQLEPHELVSENMNSLPDIAKLIQSKL